MPPKRSRRSRNGRSRRGKLQRREQQQKQQQEQRHQYERELCLRAAACEKYSAMRLECATAGNFKNCLHIKMGAQAIYIDPCSGFNEGAPAVPSPPETPGLSAL
jgi:hypothetical protein